MLIGGLQKFSLLDYPGKISAIIFTQGCNFRCQFCYNPMLVWPIRPADVPASGALAGEGGKLRYAHGHELERQKVHSGFSSASSASRRITVDEQDELFDFFKARAGKLDAVVITGGEPCLQKDLLDFIKKVKALGYLVKLDTNGSCPEVLAKLTSPRTPSLISPLVRGRNSGGGEGSRLIDYLAMDLKAPASKYAELTGDKADFNNVRKSVKLIMASGLPYEFRTTVVPELLDKADIKEMGKIIKGADLWYLQNFKSRTQLLCPELEGKVPYNARQMKEMAAVGGEYVKKCEVR